MKKRARTEEEEEEFNEAINSAVEKTIARLEKKQKTNNDSSSSTTNSSSSIADTFTSQVLSIFYNPPSFEDQIYGLLGDIILPTITKERIKPDNNILNPSNQEYKYEVELKCPNLISSDQMIALSGLKSEVPILQIHVNESNTPSIEKIAIFCSNDKKLKRAFERADLIEQGNQMENKINTTGLKGEAGEELKGIVKIIKNNIKINEDLTPPPPETKVQPTGAIISYTHHFIVPPITLNQINRVLAGSSIIRQLYFRPDEGTTNILMTVEVLKEVS